MADDPDTLVDLVRTGDELQAVSLIAELEANGVPARAFGLGIMQYQMPMLQPQRVMVRRGDLARAQEVLKNYQPPGRQDFEWEEVDTGDTAPLTPQEEAGPQFVCARCGYSRHGLAADSRCPECGAPPARRYELTAGEQSPGIAQHLLWLIVGVLVLLTVLGLVL